MSRRVGLLRRGLLWRAVEELRNRVRRDGWEGRVGCCVEDDGGGGVGWDGVGDCGLDDGCLAAELGNDERHGHRRIGFEKSRHLVGGLVLELVLVREEGWRLLPLG